MDPILAARLRRDWPMIASLSILVVFLLAHLTVFGPLVTRFHAAQERAGALGAAVGGTGGAPTLPPRVFTVLMANSLPGAEADHKGASGTLGAELVQSLSAIAGRHGLEVVVAEPGVLTQQPAAVEVRAHLKLRGEYAGLVGLLDELEHGGRLVLLERFSVTPATGAKQDIELWVSSCLLRRQGSGS